MAKKQIIHFGTNGLSFYLSIFIFLVSLIMLARPTIDFGLMNHIFVNPDSLFHTTFYQEIITSHKAINNWIFPHSFLLLPDFGLFLLVKAFLGNSHALVNITTSILILALLEVAFFILYKEPKLKSPHNITFIVLISIFNLVLGTEYFQLFYGLLLTPHFHNGTIFNVLVGLLLTELLIRHWPNKSLLVIYYFWVLLSTFSDSLFVFWFTVPILISLYLIRALDRATVLKLGVGLIAASVLGLLAYKVLPSTEVTLFKVTQQQVNLHTLLEKQITYFREPGEIKVPNYIFLHSILLTVSLIAFIRLIVTKKKLFYTLLGPFVLINLLIGILLFNLWGESSWVGLRMFTPTIFFILFALFKEGGIYFGNSKTKQIILVVIIGTLLIVKVITPGVDYKDLTKDDDRQIECILKLKNNYKWDYGISNFWTGAKLNTLSNNKVNILSIEPAVKPRAWIPFGDKRYAGNMNIDFAYITSADEVDYFNYYFGPPDMTFDCAEKGKVFYFKDNKIKKLIYSN